MTQYKLDDDMTPDKDLTQISARVLVMAVWEDTAPWSPTFDGKMTVCPIAEIIETRSVPVGAKMINRTIINDADGKGEG